VSYLSDLAADNQRANAPPVSVLSLLFRCFRLNSLSVISRFSLKSQVFSGFLFLSYQSAIGQANRRRAERLKLPANHHARTFPNLTICYCFRVGPTIGKNDEAGNIARLNHKFALALTPHALCNFASQLDDRADLERQHRFNLLGDSHNSLFLITVIPAIPRLFLGVQFVQF
jgi:hypothetical protein